MWGVPGALKLTAGRHEISRKADKEYYKSMSKKANPFGDGKSSELILKICESYFNGDN